MADRVVPLRLTVALTEAEMLRVLAGGEVVMQASSGLSVIFEVAVTRRGPAAATPPPQPAPVPAPDPWPALPAAAAKETPRG